MKILIALLLVNTFGAVITVHAADAKTTAVPAYYISEFEVTDAEAIKPYSAQVTASFESYGGRYLVRGGKITSLEGKQDKRIVIIAFDSIEQARNWYNSQGYQTLIPIRQKSANARVYFVEGLPLLPAAQSQ